MWQTGKHYVDKANNFVKENELSNIYVSDFIYKMDFAYAISDVIISSAGAIAVAEISNVKKPSILIPYPFATDDHQTKNALALSSKNAAILLKDIDVEENLEKELNSLLNNVQF